MSKQITVGELLNYIKDLPHEMPVWLTGRIDSNTFNLECNIIEIGTHHSETEKDRPLVLRAN